jgi:hypothetical protein
MECNNSNRLGPHFASGLSFQVDGLGMDLLSPCTQQRCHTMMSAHSLQMS